VHSEIIEAEFYVGPFSLAGQMDYPEGDGPFPAVLIIPGPPSHDRYGNVRGYKAYNNYLQQLAEVIVDAGYAVFRWDKGGTGKSSSGLSAPQNMVAAYKQMCSMPKVDLDKTALLAIAGGSAFVYRKWLELEEINPIEQLTLLSTGVNDLKLEDLDIPICLIRGTGGMIRSKRALEKYQVEKNVRIQFYEAKHANEQLLDETDGKVNLFTDDTARWDAQSLEILHTWFASFID